MTGHHSIDRRIDNKYGFYQCYIAESATMLEKWRLTGAASPDTHVLPGRRIALKS